MEFQVREPLARHDCRRDEVRSFLAAVVDPDHGVFLGSPSPRWFCPPGNDLDLLLARVEELSDQKATYFGLNPCPVGEKTLVRNVIHRRWLLLDFDPLRLADAANPAAGYTKRGEENSTDEEHEAAHAAACRALDYLTECGWPLPLCVDSGNGWHMLYRIDLPNDPLSRSIVAAVLQHVADRCDTNGVKLGIECFNANRLSKVAGTKTRRGPHSDERPQRWARLVYLPDPVEIVPTALLMQLTGVEPKAPPTPPAPLLPPPKTPSVNGNGRPHQFQVPVHDYTAYVKKIVREETAKIVMAGVHGRNTALNSSAYKLGQLVGAGVLDEGEALTVVIDAAERNGVWQEEAEKSRETITRALQDGMAVPKVLPTREAHGKAAPAAKPSPPTLDPSVPLTVCASTVTPKKVPWLWPLVVPKNFITVFAGRTGIGKSFVTCDFVAVIGG